MGISIIRPGLSYHKSNQFVTCKTAAQNTGPSIGPINLLSDRLLRYVLIHISVSDFGARFGSRYQNKNIRRYLRGPSESRLIGSLITSVLLIN